MQGPGKCADELGCRIRVMAEVKGQVQQQNEAFAILDSALQEYYEVKGSFPEGIMEGKPGNMLMIGVNGEMYPCDADVFEKTYEEV